MSGLFTRELYDLLGEDDLFRLTTAYGGFRVYIPRKLTAETRIVQELGMDLVVKLRDRYAPDRIKVPQCREFRATVLLQQGYSRREVACELGYTEKAFRRLVGKLPLTGFNDAFFQQVEQVE